MGFTALVFTKSHSLSKSVCIIGQRAVSWLRRLVAGFDPGSVDVGFVVDKVALGQVFPPLPRFSPVNFIPQVLYYTEKRKKLIIIITVLHNKPQGCGASVASAARPFTIRKIEQISIIHWGKTCHWIMCFLVFKSYWVSYIVSLLFERC
jgi:hypothetical protein